MGLTPWHRADSGRIYSDHGPNLRWRNPFGSGDHRRSRKAALGGRGTAEAVTLVLGAVPEGWGAALLDTRLKPEEVALLNMRPGDVREVDEIVADQCVCGRIAGLNRAAFGAHSLNDRAGSLDREPRVPEMRKDRHRQAFASERAGLPRRRPGHPCRSRSHRFQGCLDRIWQ
jgi:hypothetical protein